MSTVTFDVVRASTKYVVDENGDVSQVAANTPAFEYNADGTYKGMSVEEERENGIRNSEGGGSTNGVIGSGGALPTNWSNSALNGLVAEVIGTGTETGVEYVDVKFSGTATSTASFSILFESTSQITASQNEVWSGSVYLKYTDQTANPDNVRLGIAQYDSTPSFLKFDTQTITPTTTLTRFKQENVTLDNASVASVVSFVRFGITNAQAYDFTIRFGLPQLEEGEHASSVIKTSGTSATRNKDDISNTSASTYTGQTAGTVFVEVDWNLVGTTQYLIDLNDDTSNNRVFIYVVSNNLRMFLRANNVQIIDQGESATAYTGIQKIAFVYAENDFRLYRNGSQISSSTSGSVASLGSLTHIDVGQTRTATAQANMHIRAFALYKRALTDTEAIALTS